MPRVPWAPREVPQEPNPEPDPRRSDAENAYHAYCKQTREAFEIKPDDAGAAIAALGLKTREQLRDIRCALLDKPISSWVLFKAGWDARRGLPFGRNGEEWPSTVGMCPEDEVTREGNAEGARLRREAP